MLPDDTLRTWKTTHNKLRASLIKAGFTTAGEVLSCPPSSLQSRAKLSIADAELCKTLMAEWRMPRSQTVAEGLSDPPWLRSGVEALDSLLGGGLAPGTITEIYGEASAGKSNVCLQLCLQVQLPQSQGGLNGSVLYLSSEGAFPVVRLRQMALSRGLTLTATNHVVLAQMKDFEDLEHAVLYTMPVLHKQLETTDHPLKLLIIDSIAAPLRSEYASSNSSLGQRGKDVSAFAYRMRALAVELNLVSIVTNQVSDSYDPPFAHPVASPLSEQSSGPFFVGNELKLPYTTQLPHFAQASRSSRKHAALGLSWANMVDTRLSLARTEKRRTIGTPGPEQEVALVRAASVVFSPFAPPASIQYAVADEGIVTPWETRTAAEAAGQRDQDSQASNTPFASSTTTLDSLIEEEEDMALWQEFELDPSVINAIPEGGSIGDASSLPQVSIGSEQSLEV